tara:strand:- start:3057 stop:3704 length:648 start_codon:yes stop_codon:yes gene_type:complete
MTQIFQPSTDRWLRFFFLAFVLIAVGTIAVAVPGMQSAMTGVGYQPTQPVPFSHKLHAGELAMDCTYCHNTVDRADYAAIPTTETCLNCHARVVPNSPLLVDVFESYGSRVPIEWIRVHRLPDYTYFSHQAHVTVGVSCVSCHGRVDQMEEVRQVEPLNMAWCLDCHRHPEAELRPSEFVTDLAWQPDNDPVELGRQLRAMNDINPPENCSACHR